MEQKKTLWIIAASGVFLLVVIGAALLLNAPTSNNAPATASITTVERPSAEWKAPAAETVSEALPAENTETTAESGFAFERIEGNAGESYAEAAQEEKVLAAQAAETEKSVSVEVNNASTGITPASKGGELAMAQASKPKADTIYTAPKTTASKPAAAAPKVASSPAKTTVAKPAAPAPVTAPKYWVQAASFTNKKSADTARSTLDDNRIPAEVFTYKDGKDNLFYRVRVGPYTTKSEAEYWKNRICMIDLFKETQSYVTQVN